MNDGGKPKVQVFTTGEVVAFMVPLQRLWTGWSGAIINVLRIIKEPTAVAIAYELDQPCAGESNVLRFLFCFVLLVVVLFSVCLVFI